MPGNWLADLILCLVGYFLYLVSWLRWPFSWCTRTPFTQYQVQIRGMGTALPHRSLTNSEVVEEMIARGGGETLQARLESYREKSHQPEVSAEEMISQRYGVQTRYWADRQTQASDLAVQACHQALERAELKVEEIDLLVYASASPDQLIPDTSVFVHEKLGMRGTPSQTVHATCLSFLHAMNNVIPQLETGRYQHVLVVSAEKSNSSLDPHDLKTFTTIGDAAGAVVLSRVPTGETSRIISSRFRTFSQELSHSVEVPMGICHHPSEEPDQVQEMSRFRMDGEHLMSKVPQLGLEFIQLFGIQDWDHVVAHQPSEAGLQSLRRVLPQFQIFETYSEIGNCVAACLPYNLCRLWESGALQRGQKVLLIGAGAGLHLGMIELVF